MHMRCICGAHAVHMRCTCGAHAVHMWCICGVRVVHTQRPSGVSHTAWHPRSTMVRGRSSAQSCRRCRKRIFCVTMCHWSTKGCCMRAESASELKSTALSPRFSQCATLASSKFRPERLAGKTQSARAAPSARAERAARRQAVSLSVLAIVAAAPAGSGESRSVGKKRASRTKLAVQEGVREGLSRLGRRNASEVWQANNSPRALQLGSRLLSPCKSAGGLRVGAQRNDVRGHLRATSKPTHLQAK